MIEKLKSIDKGIVFMLISSFFGALNGAIAKILSDSMDPVEVVFYRNLLGGLIVLYSLQRIKVSFNPFKIHLLFLRGLFGGTAMVLFFYTISTIPLGEAVVLNKTSPFFVTIIAYYLMKERINLSTFFALIIGFIGVISIMKPFGLEVSIDHIFGVLSGLFSAAAYATIKKIKDIYDAIVIMLSFMTVGMFIPLGLFLFTPYVQFQIHTDLLVWLLIGFMALISTASQWFLTKAYSLSKASIIGVISYSNIPFALGFGIMLGDKIPDIYVLIGIVLIVFGGVLVSKK